MDLKEYQARLEGERRVYDDCENLEEQLPQIFHYWSTRHISPMLAPLGFSNSNGMFQRYLEQQCQAASGEMRCVSIGAGNCKLEIDLASYLRSQGHERLVIDCLDLNEATLDRGRAAASAAGIGECLNFVQADFNTWRPADEYDAVIANQALHHVLNLENLFAEVKNCLKPGGRFVISDMIGRNGHQLWPEALEAIREFWPKLPPSYRYNHQLKRYEEWFTNWDYSRDGFEAVRSEDILRLLTEHFHFELFAAFGNLIYPFVERSFGPNFDPGAEWDRAFIDEVHARDQQEIHARRFQPAHMLAVVGNDERAATRCIEPLRPEFCIRSRDGRASDEPHGQAGRAYEWNSWPHNPQAELEIACKRLTETEDRLRRVNTELDKCAALAAHFDAERNERTAWALRLDRELRETAAPVQSLQKEIEERTAWAQQLEKELQDRTAWALQLSRELEESTTLCKRLLEENEERTAWAVKVQHELDERTEWALQLKSELEQLKWHASFGLRQAMRRWIRKRLGLDRKVSS